MVILFSLFAALPLSSQEARQVFEALLRAYPDRISDLKHRNGDWSILVNGKTFYWSDGRLLPAKDKGLEKEYSPYHFRPNPRSIPPIRRLSPAERVRLEASIRRQESRRFFRHPAFLTSLWGMENPQIAEQTLQAMVFLGRKIRVHPYIIDELTLVEREIRESASRDDAVEIWMNNLSTVDAYVWRDIAGSANRSLHSFGLAIDLLSDDYGGKQVYWRWSRRHYPEWWAIPHENRHSPPTVVIEAFENHGFIWGGKWFFFDQIHFEYRPELLDEKLGIDEPKKL